MKQKDKKMLKVAVLMSILSVYPYSVSFADGVITTVNPDPGTYDSIDRVVNGDDGLNIPSYGTDGGDYIITNGGRISLTTNSTTAYGLWVSEGDTKPTNLNIGGDFSLTIDNSAFSGTADKVIGVWKYAGYNPIPGTGQPEEQGGIITLNNATVDVTAGYNAYGLLAGEDFGGNSVGGGHIVVNGNLTVNSHTLNSVRTGIAGRTFGIAAIKGLVELNGTTNNITVTADKSDGGSNRETSGLFTTGGGKITSQENTTLRLNITNTNTSAGGKTIYGINSGYYDQTPDYEEYQGISGVELNGKTIINLDTMGNATGVKSAIMASDYIKDLTVNFNYDDTYQYKRVGVVTETGATVTVDSLHIGTAGTVNNPNHITALQTSTSQDLFSVDYGTAGTINVNQSQTNEVQLVGRLYSVDKGTINLNLSNNTSYLYGNTKISWWGHDDGFINLDIANGAKWINVQNTTDTDSTLTTLTLANGGIVDLTDTVYTDISEHKYQNIYINNTFDGSGGTIHMDIDASTNTDNSDRVYVDGTHSGTHYITLNNVGSNVDGAAGTVLVSVNDEQGEFKANDSEGTLYWNKYTLDRLDKTEGETVTDGYNTDWILAEVEQTDKPTTSVDTILGANALNYHTWLLESDKLMKRMGDLRHNGKDEQGAWFRVRGSKISRDDSAAFENKYTTYELGYDTLDKETEDYKRYAGASISYSDGTSSYERGSGENSGKAISFYSTTMRNKGHYLDFVFKVVDMDNDFSVFDTNGNNISGAMDNQGISVNVEYGRKKDLGDKWYIEPQSQLTFGYLGGDNYKLNNGIAVDQGGISSLVGRIGFNIGRDIDEKTNLYLKANLLHEFLGDYSLDMTDTATGDVLRKDGSFGDTWGEVGIGAAIQTGKNNHIYFDVEKTFGGDFEKDWGWNAGMRWTF